MEQAEFINRLFDTLYHARVNEAELARKIGMSRSSVNYAKRKGHASVKLLRLISEGANLVLAEKGQTTRFSVDVSYNVEE